MEELIYKRISRAIEERVFPGCVVGLIKNGEQKILPYGNFTYEEDSKLVKENSVYDIASITKSIPTSMSLLALIDSREIHLEDKLSKYIREFDNKDEVKIKHLLTYTLDLDIPTTLDLLSKNADEIFSIYMRAKLKNPPGTKRIYTNLSATLMGCVVDRVTNKKLPQFAGDYFFKSLGMNNTTFYPLKIFTKEEIVPTEIVDWRGGLVQGEVHDESTYLLQKGGSYFGASGLFSTAEDLLKFTEMIINKGSINGINFFSESIIKEMVTNQVDLSGINVGLGWELNEPNRMGKYSSEIIGKSGFTGCMIMINSKKNSSLVILSNRTYPKRTNTSESINSLRRDVADIVFE